MKHICLLGISLVICLSSCDVSKLTFVATPKYLDVPLEYNARSGFQPDSARVLFINRANLAKPGLNERKLKTIKAGAYSSIKYAAEQLELVHHIKVIGLPDSIKMPVTTDSIKTLAQANHSDYILALTDYWAGVALDAMDNTSAYYSSSVGVNFTLYQGDGTYYKTLSGTAEMPRSTQPNFGLLASLVLQPGLKGSKDSIISASRVAVFYALLDYLPHSTTHRRPLYNDDGLKPAVTEILAGHFDTAYNLSAPFLKSADVKLASRAAYNLAVVYEAQGDIAEAVSMAQFSLDKGQNPFASAILKDLKDEQ